MSITDILPDANSPMTDDDWATLGYEISTQYSETPIRESDFFAGRTAEVARMLKATISTGKHVVLFGDKGVGKTSLSNVFWKRFNLQLKSFIVAKVQSMPDDDFDALWRRAFDELIDYGADKGISEDFGESVNQTPITPSQVRRELNKINANLLPIIIFDEYNEIDDENTRRQTANLIKELYDFSITTTLILVGVADNIATLLEDHQSVDRALVQIPLLRMSAGELIEINENGVRNTRLSFSTEAKWTIVNLSRGLPYFTQSLSKFAADTAIKNRSLIVTNKHVESALDEFIQDSGQSFNDGFTLATRSNQSNFFKQSLLSCALADADDYGFFTANDVVKPYSGIMKEPKKIAHFEKHLRRFSSSDGGNILTSRGGDRQKIYRFTDPMMQPYVIIRGIQAGLIDEEAKTVLLSKEQLSLAI